MKHAAYGLLAAFLAMGVYGAIPDSAKDWYTPPGGFSRQSGIGTVYYEDFDSGSVESFDVSVDDKGKVEMKGYVPELDRQPELKTALMALLKACENEAVNDLQKKEIEELGKNLDKVFKTEGMTVSGTDAKGNSFSYTLKFGNGGGIGAGEYIGANVDQPTHNLADEKSITQLGDGRYALMGIGGARQHMVPYRNASGGISWDFVGSDFSADDVTITTNGSGRAHLVGWTDDTKKCNTNLKTIMTEESGVNRAAHYVLTRYGTGDNAEFHYVPFGDRLEFGGGAPVDGVSITTNANDGAVSQGDASLYGWATEADEGDIPSKGSDGHLKWTAPADMVDGASIGMTDAEGGGKVWEVKDAHVYAGHQAKHYFGTGNDKSATLGWHELPNVTTNRVEGDNITIASTVDDQDPGLKRLGLLGWNKTWSGDPLFVVNAGGSVGYIPLPALTNLAACACTQKWENAVAWIGGDAALDEDGGLTLPDDSLDGYLYGTLGYIYSTTADNLHFDNDGDTIQASFTAPENWADGDSVELTEDGTYQIKGFADASACAASMSAMLSNPSGSDATTHLLLAKKTDTGELHYVPIGAGVKSGAEVDGVTITTNTTSGAASIYGWANAQNDTYLSKNGSGNLEWRELAGGAPVDDTSITTNTAHGAVTSGNASIYGFADAPVGTTPIVASVNGQKVLRWGLTGNFGLTATKSGAGWTYTVSSGYYTRARSATWVSSDLTVSSSGWVYLKVPIGTGSNAVLEYNASSVPSSSSTYTYLPLYYLNTSVGVTDYRCQPHVQVWE